MLRNVLIFQTKMTCSKNYSLRKYDFSLENKRFEKKYFENMFFSFENMNVSKKANSSLRIYVLFIREYTSFKDHVFATKMNFYHKKLKFEESWLFASKCDFMASLAPPAQPWSLRCARRLWGATGPIYV